MLLPKLILCDLALAASREPYWLPLQWPEVQQGCHATSGNSLAFSLARENASIKPLLRVPATKLVKAEAPRSWLRGAHALARRLYNCTSVRSCSFSWSFLAILFGAPTGQLFETEERRATWETLWNAVSERMVHFRYMELQRRRETFPISPFGGPQERQAPMESSSVLLLSADNRDYFQRPFVSPFVRQLECYASKRGMQFAADGGPWPLRHVTLGLTGNYFFVGRWKEGRIDAAVAREEEYLRHLIRDLQRKKLGRAVELAALEGLVNIYFDEPEKQTKIWSIERQLENSSMVVYLDLDVTIRPDSLQWGLVPLLVSMQSRRVSDIFVRDSWPGTECLNSGFIAVRSTRASRLFLELWRQKAWWPVSWDQSALAESVLELIGLEMTLLGRPGYRSQCLRYLFPIANGLVPYAMYCDCWQSVLSDMIGPYRQRRSRLVTFVDPERLDVNFVPSDLFVGHGFSLESMHLVAGLDKPTMNPLIVHWAGTGRKRLWIAQEYLQQRFNTSLQAGICGEHPSPSFEGSLTPRFDSRARAVRCCTKLQQAQKGSNGSAAHRQVTLQEVAFWGCCDWQPVRPRECLELVGS